MSNEHTEAAARAKHYARTDPLVNRVTPMGGEEQRNALGDFFYQAGTQGVGDLGATALVAGAVAAGKAAVDKVTGAGDSKGKHAKE